MGMRVGALVSTAAVFMLALLAAAGAQESPVVTKTVQRGEVRVVVRGSWTTWRGRVTITRRDRVLTLRRFHGAIPESLRVRDLDGDRESEVIVTLAIGGAHNRAYSVFFSYDPSATRYRELTHWWHEIRPKITDLNDDGAIEFIAADMRFYGEFISFGGSGVPVQVWTFRRSSLVDTTRGYATLIREDAAQLWRWYLLERRRSHPDARGILAAYQADKYLLGEQNDGWRRLETAYRRGDLGRTPTLHGFPAGKRYLWKLRRFLRQTGYAPG